MDNDPYKTLGVSRDASERDIKSAYRRLARNYHPDRNPGDHKAKEEFLKIKAAYDVLGNSEKKGEYDSRRAAEEESRREAERRTRRQAEERAKREAEERARREAEHRARKETEGRAKRDAERRARKQSEEQARKETEDRHRAKRETPDMERAGAVARKDDEGYLTRSPSEIAKDSDVEPHRGWWFLLFGLFAFSGGMVTGIVFLLGPVVWIMASGDLQKMRLGKMDRDGEFLTQVARFFGMAATLALVIVICALMFCGGAILLWLSRFVKA